MVSPKKKTNHCIKKSHDLEILASLENQQEKQTLQKIHQHLRFHLEYYLILTEMGNPIQIALAQQEAKIEFLKFGGQMLKIARELNESLEHLEDPVADFLESIEMILECQDFLNEEKISECLLFSQRLDHCLKSYNGL